MMLKHIMIEGFLIGINVLLVLVLFVKLGISGILWLLLGLFVGVTVVALFYRGRVTYSTCRRAYENNDFSVNKLRGGFLLVLIYFILLLAAVIGHGFIGGLIMGLVVTWYLLWFCQDLIYSLLIHNKILDEMIVKRFKWLK